MVILGSLTLVVCEALQFDPKPFLISEALIMDVGGLSTIVSSIPNMIVGRSAGYDFVSFFLKFAPFVLLGSITTIYFCKRVFAKELNKNVKNMFLQKPYNSSMNGVLLRIKTSFIEQPEFLA